MKTFGVQMLSHSVPAHWWKALMAHFVHAGDSIELRCWKEEQEEIAFASAWGTPKEEGYEVSIKGVVTPELLESLLGEEPLDKTIYNKMTKYFTINVSNGQCDLCSAHYGTEFYLYAAAQEDAAFFHQVMAPYSEDFSISCHEGRE